MFPDVREECGVSVTPGSSAWMGQETADTDDMVQVDPANGEVLGRADAPKNSGGRAAKGEFDLASASNQSDRALGMPGGDTVFAQVNGLTRYSLKTGKVVWEFPSSTRCSSSPARSSPSSTVLPQGVTADGYLVASISNDTAVEIIAVDVKTGKARRALGCAEGVSQRLPGQPRREAVRWWRRADPQLRGLGVRLRLCAEPSLQRAIGSTSVSSPSRSLARHELLPCPPLVRSTPRPGPSVASRRLKGARITAMPGHSARVRGSSPMPGNALTGFDTKSGKQKWQLTVDDAAEARVCVAPKPDKAVKTFTIAYRDGAMGDACDKLLRIRASDGKVLNRVEVPATSRSVARILVHKGVNYVITGRRQGQPSQGRGPRRPRQAGQPRVVPRTYTSGLVTRDHHFVPRGRPRLGDRRLHKLRRCSSPSWSTKGSAVFSKVPDRKNPVVAWQGNALWVSTMFGDLSANQGKAEDSLALLDPDDGRVVSRTGARRTRRSSGRSTCGLSR